MTQEPDKTSMAKAYEPQAVEQKWYDFWMEQGYFTPEIDESKKPFVIIMPPPNITGELHMGHTMPATLEDIMARWHRMLGEPTLWLPGTDHAAIAAQVVVERQLAAEGTDRHAVGREKFLERMHQWVASCRNRITEQHKRLGISCDWTREKYTMDEGPSRAVRTTFKRLYDKGLIYRGERISNWCPRCATALSDLEVEHKDLGGHLWYVNYPLVDDHGTHITVATTRPETIVGDTAVAVNPSDERFSKLIGKKLLLPVINREIPIVGDDAVSTEFGTGAVKVTPAHDPVDFEIAQRHDLPLINILNGDVTMNENAGPYEGMDRYAAREAIVHDLDEAGLLERIEDYSHSVAHCDRCQTVVEPTVSLQWYVKIAPLAGPAIEAVTDGRIKILPDRFTKVYLNWMENIRDWCISRQLWWGHRIPVWYCRDCGEIIVAVDTPTACMKCGSTNLEQDPDTLDTWFSSGLWPHSTLGWPDDTEDLRYFYPTSVMETAYDILFFWVARMIMLGIENTGDIPFHTVYLHGLIRDDQGEKMSKTKGNGIDPLIMINSYGTDALRFAVTTGVGPGMDSRLSMEKIEAGRNFANKLWNATRFVLGNLEGGFTYTAADAAKTSAVEDRWILSRLDRTVADVIRLMEDFQFGEAERQLHDFLWNEYCDWYIELAKIRLQAGDRSPQPVLLHVLETALRLLHPFMPFITEELWQNIRPFAPELTATSIMVSPYPRVSGREPDIAAEDEISLITDIIRSIRNIRAQYRVENSRRIAANVYADAALVPVLENYPAASGILARCEPLTFVAGEPDEAATANAAVEPMARATVVIPMASMVDLAAEKKRLEKDLEQTGAEVKRLEARLQDENFMTKAPEAVVEKERQKLYTLKDKLEKLQQQYSRI